MTWIPTVGRAGEATALQDKSAPPPRRKAWLRNLTRGLLSLGLLVFLFSQFDVIDLLKGLQGLRLDLLAALVGLFLANRLVAAYRWYVLLRGFSSSIRFAGVLRLTFVSGFLGYVTPGGVGVEIFRIYGMGRASDLGLAFTSVFVERTLALLALILLVLLGIALQPPRLPASIGHLAWLALAVLAGGVAALMSRPVRELSRLVLSWLRLGALRRALDVVYGLLDKYKQRPGMMVWSLLVAIVFQLMRCLAVALGAEAFDVSLPLVIYLVIMPIIIFLTLLPISIAGLGVQEFGFVYLFGLVGMPAETALLLSLLLHVLSFMSSLPGAWFYFWSGVRA